MVGHALVFAPRAETRALWDRSIAIGFAIGSTCFFLGPFPGFIELVGASADAWVFFVGSIFFTVAAGLEAREATVRLGRWASDPSWWSAAIQFIGTLLFNLSTFEATQEGLTSQQTDRLVWAPDAFGSAAFLISGVVAYRIAERSRAPRARHPATGPTCARLAATAVGRWPRSTWPAASCSAFRRSRRSWCPPRARSSIWRPPTGRRRSAASVS